MEATETTKQDSRRGLDWWELWRAASSVTVNIFFSLRRPATGLKL